MTAIDRLKHSFDVVCQGAKHAVEVVESKGAYLFRAVSGEVKIVEEEGRHALHVVQDDTLKVIHFTEEECLDFKAGIKAMKSGQLTMTAVEFIAGIGECVVCGLTGNLLPALAGLGAAGQGVVNVLMQGHNARQMQAQAAAQPKPASP